MLGRNQASRNVWSFRIYQLITFSDILYRLELQNKTRSETDMTYSHKGTVFKISEIIFNMRIFTIEVFRTAKIV